MKIYLLSDNPQTTNVWKLYFADAENVKVVCDDFGHFMDTTEVDCVVSPANSYGIMDGGYDLAISEWFGWDLVDKVQKYILEHFRGEQPVGTSFIIDTDVKDIKLIHTPTMRIPSIIREPLVVYQCMRTCLMTAMDNEVKSIVIPAFGGQCGKLHPQTVAKMMWKGYEQVMNPPSEITWQYALRWIPEHQDI